MPQLGETVYYNATNRNNGTPYYYAAAYTGNDPAGDTAVTQQDYLNYLQSQPGTSKLGNTNTTVGAELGLLTGGQGIYSAGYIDPIYKQFQPNAPTPSEQYFTPEAQATADASKAALQQSIATNGPLQAPVQPAPAGMSPVGGVGVPPVPPPTQPPAPPAPPQTPPQGLPMPTNQPTTQGQPQQGQPQGQVPLDQLIGQRQIPGQQQVEYFNQQTGQGFSDPKQLSDFINQQSGNDVTTPENVFSFLDQQKQNQQQQQIQTQQTLEKNGIDTAKVIEGGTYKNPYQTFIDTYSDVLKQFGVGTVKTQLEDVNKKYTDLQNQKADDIAKINDDPWLTEGIRLKKIDSINNKYEVREKNLTGQITNLQKIYSDGIDQAKFVAQEATNIAHNQAVLDQNLLIQKMSLAEKALEFDQNQTKGTADLQEYQYAQAQGYSGSFLDYQRENANLKAKAGSGLLGGLTAAQINQTVNQIAGSFDNEPLVKNFGVLQEANNFVKSLSNTTTNPVDDQGLIYALAKSLDPSSAVREGEYATAQKYAQSLVQSYGKSVTQALAGTGFLSTDARENIKKTIESKYQASLQSYNNLYSQYQQRIDTAKTGQGNTLPNYDTSSNNVGGIDLSTLNFAF